MKKLLSIVVILGLIACEKGEDPQPSNQVTVKAKMYLESEGATGYWKPAAEISHPIPDSSFVVIQWDAMNTAGAFQYTLKDTVKIGPNTGGAPSKRSSFTRPSQWTAANVKVTSAWSKSGQYQFTY